MNKQKDKLEEGIKIAKYVLEQNPDDTWVRKGLEIMEHELQKIKKSEENKWQMEDFTCTKCFYFTFVDWL